MGSLEGRAEIHRIKSLLLGFFCVEKLRIEKGNSAQDTEAGSSCKRVSLLRGVCMISEFSLPPTSQQLAHLADWEL